MRIVVTGGSGFLGSHLVLKLIESGFHPIIVDSLHAGNLKKLSSISEQRTLEFFQVDIRNYDSLKKIFSKVDVVVHLAAMTSIRDSIKNPLTTYEVNVTGTLNVLKSCLENKVKKLIFASSAAVYGDPVELPLKESSPLNPISPYGVSKLIGEKYIDVFRQTFNLEAIILRFFNIYGLGQLDSRYLGVIPTFIRRIMQDKPPIIFGDGKQTRDFIHVSDVVKAILSAIDKTPIKCHVFNIASGKPTTIKELAKLVIRISGKNLKPIYKKEKPGEIKHSYADVSNALKWLNFKCKIKLSEGLQECILKWKF